MSSRCCSVLVRASSLFQGGANSRCLGDMHSSLVEESALIMVFPRLSSLSVPLLFRDTSVEMGGSLLQSNQRGVNSRLRARAVPGDSIDSGYHRVIGLTSCCSRFSLI